MNVCDVSIIWGIFLRIYYDCSLHLFYYYDNHYAQLVYEYDQNNEYFLLPHPPPNAITINLVIFWITCPLSQNGLT